MTTQNDFPEPESCPATNLLKLLAGKWKPEIYRLALAGPLRFNTLLRQLPGSNKQSVSVALKELEEAGLLQKIVIKEKPLHIEYNLTERGLALVPVFKQLEGFSTE
jgi:DNA-binding HxlR family transcriptional regulator